LAFLAFFLSLGVDLFAFGETFSFFATITGNVMELSGTKVNTILSLFELFEFDFNNKEETKTSCSIT